MMKYLTLFTALAVVLFFTTPSYAAEDDATEPNWLNIERTCKELYPSLWEYFYRRSCIKKLTAHHDEEFRRKVITECLSKYHSQIYRTLYGLWDQFELRRFRVPRGSIRYLTHTESLQLVEKAFPNQKIHQSWSYRYFKYSHFNEVHSYEPHPRNRSVIPEIYVGNDPRLPKVPDTQIEVKLQSECDKELPSEERLVYWLHIDFSTPAFWRAFKNKYSDYDDIHLEDGDIDKRGSISFRVWVKNPYDDGWHTVKTDDYSAGIHPRYPNRYFESLDLEIPVKERIL